MSDLGRRCIGCGRPIRWRTVAFCTPGCRTKFYCDHPALRPTVQAQSCHTRVVAIIEARFVAAKQALRRASTFTVDPWAQRPGAGRAMEDWGHEE